MSATLKSLEAVKSKMNDQQQEFQQILTEFELQKQKFEDQKQKVEQYLAQNDDLHFYDNTHELVGKIIKAGPSSYDVNQSRQFSYFYGSHIYSTGCHRIQIKILDPAKYDGSPMKHLLLGIVKFSENKKQPQPSY